MLWRQSELEAKRSADQYARVQRAEQDSKLNEMAIRLKVLQTTADEKFADFSKKTADLYSLQAQVQTLSARQGWSEGIA
jgi:hypothetical protein